MMVWRCVMQYPDGAMAELSGRTNMRRTSIKVLPHIAWNSSTSILRIHPLSNSSLNIHRLYLTLRGHHVSRRRLLLPPSHLRQRLAQMVRDSYSIQRGTTNFDNSVVNGEKRNSGLIRKYELNMSRQAFREKAADMGWVKVRRQACDYTQEETYTCNPVPLNGERDNGVIKLAK